MALIAACGSNTGTTGSKDSSAAAPVVSNDPSTNPDYEKGLDLIAKSDCLTCHKVSEKLKRSSNDAISTFTSFFWSSSVTKYFLAVLK